jgi:hypothetical protein
LVDAGVVFAVALVCVEVIAELSWRETFVLLPDLELSWHVAEASAVTWAVVAMVVGLYLLALPTVVSGASWTVAWSVS